MSDNGKVSWITERRKLSDLKPWPRNPRQIKTDQAKRLVDSFAQFGQVETIAIGPDNDIYNGHQRLFVLEEQYGEDYEVDVRVASRALTEKEREKLTVYLHKGAAGEWDFDVLANEFELDDLLEWGFDKQELDIDLWLPEPPEDPGAQMDRAEELREKWGIETGQLWQLGEHRLICGDCTDRAVVEKVMGGEKAEMVFTDPPYNALKSWDKDEAHSETRLDPTKWFTNDNMEWDEYIDFLDSAFGLLGDAHSVYVCCDFRIYNLIVAGLFARGYDLKHCIVWKKNVWGLGKRYRFQHEFIVYATEEAAPFYGDRAQSDVWEVDVDKSIPHNTPKPVGLSELAIPNSCSDRGIVYDGFLGSGTTLIACERLGRKCRAVEISPAYCAVAIQRWVDMTGGTPSVIQKDTEHG